MMISGYKSLPLPAESNGSITYRLAVTVSRAVGEDDDRTVSKVVHAKEWVEECCSGVNYYAICGSNISPRRLVRQEARRIYKLGQERGTIPSGFLSGLGAMLFGNLWMKIILLLIEHWISQGGQWEE
jgi:hypothetical protein